MAGFAKLFVWTALASTTLAACQTGSPYRTRHVRNVEQCRALSKDDDIHLVVEALPDGSCRVTNTPH